MKFWHVFYPVWRSYIFFVSFVQSPFKEALRDLSCSSDLSELAVPWEKGSALDKNLQKNSIREWLLLAPRHQPPSLNLGILQNCTTNPPQIPFPFRKLNLNSGCGFEYRWWRCNIQIFKISLYLPFTDPQSSQKSSHLSIVILIKWQLLFFHIFSSRIGLFDVLFISWIVQFFYGLFNSYFLFTSICPKCTKTHIHFFVLIWLNSVHWCCCLWNHVINNNQSIIPYKE